MDGLNTKSKLHIRVSKFVDWIAPDPKTRETIKKQADEIRERIGNKATEDGLRITLTPKAGSFAKKTGLKRHMRGTSEIEGQDVDLPFVVKLDTGKFEMEPMLDKFLMYANDSYPNTEKEPTKSSINLKFTNTLSYDLVPLFATDDLEEQILVRSTGEQIRTSVQKHTDFVRDRIEKSEQKQGVVLFNECVRLMKWWRDVRCANASYLKEVSSTLIEILCAKAFDQFSVQTTYAHTLSEWSIYLAHVVVKKETVWFTDYFSTLPADSESGWRVIDPVNPGNNIARGLKPYEVDELSDWFQNARDTWNRVIAADMTGDDSRTLEQLVYLFGNSIKNHCGE